MAGNRRSQSKASTPQKSAPQSATTPLSFGSNMEQNATMTGPSASRGAGIGQAIEDLGEVASLGGGFTSKAGGIVDALVPNDGDSGKLDLTVNLPVDASGTVKVAFNFNTQVSRSEKGVKGKVKLGGGVTASKDVDLYFFTAQVFAKVQAFGYLEASGDSGKEIFDLFSLALHQLVAKQSTDLADAMFSAKYIADVVKGMDKDDYVEAGLGVELSAGGEVGTKTKSGKELSASAEGKSEGVAATRFQKDGSGRLTEKDASSLNSELSAGLKGDMGPFKMEGALTGKFDRSKLSEIEAEVKGKAVISGKELSDLVVGGNLLTGMISQFGKLVNGRSALFKADASAGRKVGALASYISSATGLGNVAQGASVKAIDKMGRMGAKLGHKMSVTGTYDVAKNDLGLSIKLERVSEMSYGDADKDTFAVVAENIQRVFELKI